MDSRSFLGLEPTHNRFRWKLPVTRKISVGENFLFGGCGPAAAISAAKERRVVDASGQPGSTCRMRTRARWWTST